MTSTHADPLYRALALASRHLQAAVESRLRSDAGISLPEYEILAAVAASDGGRARPRMLGDMLTWEKSRVSHQVTRMVQRGLVKRTTCAGDQRGTWIELDEAGVAASAAGREAFSREIAARLGSLPSAEATALTGSLLELAHRADPGECSAQLGVIAREAGLSSPPDPGNSARSE